ncbi:MAG: hypothetical protein ACRD5H_06840, partial [Nitrososphaerales archaeon]
MLSTRIDYVCVCILLLLSIIYFADLLTNDYVVAHGDLKYALTISEHFSHHLDSLATHASKLPFLLILFPLQMVLGDNLAEKAFIVFILFLSVVFVYFANKYFISHINNTTSDRWLSLSSLAGTFIFLYNPWTINKIHHHYWLVLSLAASYLIIASIDKLLLSKRFYEPKQIIVLAMAGAAMATQPQSPLIYFVPMIALYFLSRLAILRTRVFSVFQLRKARLALWYSCQVTLVIACNLFWLMPSLGYVQSGSAEESAESGEYPMMNFTTNTDRTVTLPSASSHVSYGRVEENVDQLSRRATLLNVLQGTSAWVWGGDATPDQSIVINGANVWEVIAYFPLIISILFFLMAPRKSIRNVFSICFALLLALSIFLSTGSYYSSVYKEAFLNLPLGEAIRDPYKFSGLYFLATSFFASALISIVSNARKSVKVTLLSSIFAITLLWGWVGLTGNLNSHLGESLLPYPADLERTINYLYSQDNDRGSILWYPAGADVSRLQYSSIPELSTSSFQSLELSEYERNYIDHLTNYRDEMLITLLEYLGVHYVIVRDDLKGGPSESPPELTEKIEGAKQLLREKQVYSFGRFT